MTPTQYSRAIPGGRSARILSRDAGRVRGGVAGASRLQTRKEGGLLPRNPFRYALVATLGVGVALALLAALSSLATVLTYVGIALFLSVAVDPVVEYATSRGMRRGVATLLLAIVFLLVIAGLTTAVIPAATAQVEIVGRQTFTWLESLPQQEWFDWLSENLPETLDLGAVLGQLTTLLSDPGQLMAIGGGLLQVGTGIIDAVTGTLVVAALTIYFVISLPRIKAKTYLLLPYSRRDWTIRLTEEILQSVGRYVGGQLGLAAVNAAFTFLLTSIVGSPAPALLAVIAFIGALIPVIGTVLGATIATLLTLTVSPVGAVIVAVVMLVYMQVEAYVLAPRVMARAVAVPGALVIIAALGGAALGGILGALLAVPVAAAGLLIVDRVIIPHQQRA